MAGALVAIGLSFLLNLFGVAIGLSAFSNSPEGTTAFAVSGFVGLVIAAFVSMFMGGWVAGHLGSRGCSSNGCSCNSCTNNGSASNCCNKRKSGELYGFAAWCLALIFTIILASPVSHFITQYNNVVNPYTTTVKMTNNEDAPLVTTQTRTSPSTNATTTQMTVNTEKAVNTLGQAAFITFFLFFIGALASCFGGHCGMAMCCKRKCMPKESCTPTNNIKS